MGTCAGQTEFFRLEKSPCPVIFFFKKSGCPVIFPVEKSLCPFIWFESKAPLKSYKKDFMAMRNDK